MDFSSLNTAFWAGLALAIPLAVAANLLTPFFQSRWADRSEKSRNAKRAQAAKELGLLVRYRSNKEDYNDYQFSVILRTTIIGAIAAGIGAAMAGLGNLAFALPKVPFKDQIANSAFFASQVVFTVSSLIIMNIARQAWRYHRALADLDTYAKDLGFDPARLLNDAILTTDIATAVNTDAKR